MAVLRAALGFRLHTGWAVVVAAARASDRIEVLLSRRMELLPADGSIPRFVFHTAAELEGTEPAALVKRASAGALKTARAALKEIVVSLRHLDIAVDAAAIPAGSAKVPAELEKILASHPLIHAAEGALFQRAVSDACEHCALKIVAVHEQDAFTLAAEACGMNSAAFLQALDGLRKAVGPPWGADQKIATAAALVALAGR